MNEIYFDLLEQERVSLEFMISILEISDQNSIRYTIVNKLPPRHKIILILQHS